jgi:hypothetical protein
MVRPLPISSVANSERFVIRKAESQSLADGLIRWGSPSLAVLLNPNLQGILPRFRNSENVEVCLIGGKSTVLRG